MNDLLNTQANSVAAIENKKGNVGFYVQAWNFQGFGTSDDINELGGSVEGCIDNYDSVVKYRALKVEVYSCGKKQMKLKAVNDLFVSGHLVFNPKRYIFADIESAEKYAKDQYSKLNGDLEATTFELVIA
jgi:hypothetical protein